jgi:hypothetical protein
MALFVHSVSAVHGAMGGALGCTAGLSKGPVKTVFGLGRRNFGNGVRVNAEFMRHPSQARVRILP